MKTIQSEHTSTFTDENFQREVLQADTPVLVDFWAEWCPPCKALTPTIDELATEYVGRVKVGKVDVDSNAAAPSKYGVQSIPNIVLFKDGEMIQRFVGVTTKKDLQEALDKALD